MEFDVTNLNPGTWFPLGKDEKDGRICLRICDAESLRQIRKQTVKKKVEFKKVEGKPERFESADVNDDLQEELIWDYCIIDWEGILDKDKNPIPCTRENKIMLMNKSVTFAKIVSEGLSAIRDQIEEGESASEKN